MEVGSEFSCWNSFSQALERYSNDNQVSYDVGLCNPVETVNSYEDVVKYPSKFKYCYARMVCNHGHSNKTKKFQCPSKETKTRELNCSSTILISVNRDKTALVIMEVNLDHIHLASNSLVKTSRCLNEDEKTAASVLLRASVPLIRVQEFLSLYESQSSCLFMSSTEQENEDESKFLCSLHQLMTKDPECVVEIVDFNLKPGIIFIQTSQMMARIKLLLNLCIQSIQFITYKQANGKIGLIFVVGVDEDLNCHILAASISLSKDIHFQKCLEIFVKYNQNFCDICKGVVLDCGMEGSEFTRLFFHQAQVAWSRSFILENFEKGVLSYPNMYTKAMSIFKEMMNSLSECEYEKKLKSLFQICKSESEKLFVESWNSCKKLWALHRILTTDALKHQKSAVEMDFLNNLSFDFKPDMPLSDIISSLLKRDENDKKGKTKERELEELGTNAHHQFYRSVCKTEAADAVICQLVIAENSYYDINQPTNCNARVKRVDSEKENLVDTSTHACSCPFFKSTELPCQHVFAWLKYANKDICTDSLIPPKWQVFRDAVTLDSLAESIAQGQVLLSSQHRERLKVLENTMKEILGCCNIHSLDDLENDIYLLKQVLATIRRDSAGKLSKDQSSQMDTTCEIPEHLSSSMAPKHIPKKRGRKSKKEKEMISSKLSVLNFNPKAMNTHSTSNRRHNLRTNIKHKFVTRELWSDPELKETADKGPLEPLVHFPTSKISSAPMDILSMNTEKTEKESELHGSWDKDDASSTNILMNLINPTDKEEENKDPSSSLKVLKRGRPHLRLKDSKYKIVKNMIESDYSEIESDQDEEDFDGTEKINNGIKPVLSDEEWETSEAKRARLEQNLSKFLDNMSVESIQELMQDVSVIEHSSVKAKKGQEYAEWIHPVDFVIKACSQDQENLKFIIRSLEKQICDYNKFVYQLSACLILSAFNVGAQVSDIRESISEWPSHLPDLSFPLLLPDVGGMETDQILTVCGYKLHKSDMETLHCSSDLSSQVIHAYLEVLAQRHIGKMFVIPFDVIHHWRNETFEEMLFKKVCFKTFDFLILPIHCGAEFLQEDPCQNETEEAIKPHWMALIANVNKKTVGVLNPRTEDRFSIAANGYMLQWRRYMQIRSILTGEMLSSWTSEILHCSKQAKDETSGALLIMNVEAVISNVEASVMTEAHIRRYLPYVAMTLRDTDRETTVLCVGGPDCQQMAAQDTDWLQCENCHAWWHRACSGHEIKDRDKTFYCSPCRQRIACIENSHKIKLIDVERPGDVEINRETETENE